MNRQNIAEEVIGDIFGVSQSVVSNVITKLTPLIADATEEFRPDIEEAVQVTKGRLALVDGTLWPCWSWEPARELWAGKYSTTGHGGIVISDEYGNIIFVTEPAPGCDHDMAKLEGAAKEILDVAGAVAAERVSRVRGTYDGEEASGPGALCPGARVQCAGKLDPRSY